MKLSFVARATSIAAVLVPFLTFSTATNDTNPYRYGCFYEKDKENSRKRICNSDDADGSDSCVESDFEYPEIRIHNGDWVSSHLLAWINQIVLMELANVPATIGLNTTVTAETSFYAPTFDEEIKLSTELYAFYGLNKGNGNPDDEQIFDCSTTDESCFHTLPEVWETSKKEYEEFVKNQTIYPPSSNGLIGTGGLYMPSYTAQMYPQYSTWYGLQDKGKRRTDLAEIFLRPTTWKDYCNDNSTNSNRCIANDTTATRKPNPNTTEEGLYFLEGEYEGHFRFTDENNCTLNNETCTGFVASSPCEWSSNVHGQLYWNDIKSLQPVEMDYSKLIQIWKAASATQNHLIMSFFTPDPLEKNFTNTPYSFRQIDFPTPTSECLDNKPEEKDMCSSNVTLKRGLELGKCKSPPQLLRNVIVKSLNKTRSPTYEFLRNLQVTNTDLRSIITKSKNVTIREAVCDWVYENRENIMNNYFPSGYPTKARDHTKRASYKYYGFVVGVVVFGGIVALVTLLTFVLLWKYRNTKVMVFSQPIFMYLIQAALFFLTIGGILHVLEPSRGACVSSLFFEVFGNTLLFVPIIVKTSAINQLHLAQRKNKSVDVSRAKMLQQLFIVIIIVIVCLIVWFVLDPYQDHPTKYEIDEGDDLVLIKDVECNVEVLEIMWVYEGILTGLIIIASFLVFKSRHAIKHINESSTLTWMIYYHFMMHFFTLFLVYFVLRETGVRQVIKNAVFSIGTSIMVLGDMALYIFPKIIQARKNPEHYKNSLLKMRILNSSQRVETASLDDCSLELLVCTANMGNAQPNLNSMMSWIPLKGECSRVNYNVNNEDKQGDNNRHQYRRCFDLIAIGMQEATWKAAKSSTLSKIEEEKTSTAFKESMDKSLVPNEEDILNALESQNTRQLREMMTKILGDNYSQLVEEQRGQMRFFLYGHNSVIQDIDDININGANTGVGNVLANKGGIVTSFTYKEDTRLSFLSAHLAAHEGEEYYETRCENLRSILKEGGTDMFEISKNRRAFTNNEIDVSVNSHHMFVMGDLNFRTKFDMNLNKTDIIKEKEKSKDEKHEEKLERALALIEAKDYLGLYEYDELCKGLSDGDLLHGFQTLPCNFSPTFKVEREEGFVYKRQRVPSYTDRVLFKSGDGLDINLRPWSYEPSADFVTSDHKPIRAAFTIEPNRTVYPLSLEAPHHVTISNLKCSNLRSTDLLTGKSDPYVTFYFENLNFKMDRRSGLSRLKSMITLGNNDTSSSWIRTKRIDRDLNPDWGDKTFTFSTNPNTKITCDQMILVIVRDHDTIGVDDVLGCTALSMKEFFEGGEKEEKIERTLVYEGRPMGKIEFKFEIVNQEKEGAK